MVKLFIDTRDNKKVSAVIEKDGKKFEAVSDENNLRPESILNLIDSALKKAGLSKDQIDDITVEEGPGSYTGLKVGVSVANALSFALGKKVNGKEFGSLIEPVYE